MTCTYKVEGFTPSWSSAESDSGPDPVSGAASVARMTKSVVGFTVMTVTSGVPLHGSSLWMGGYKFHGLLETSSIRPEIPVLSTMSPKA